MAEVICTNCGHLNPPSSNFCSSCGQPLEVAREDHTVTLAPVEGDATGTDDDFAVALDDLEDGAGMLVVKRGPGAGSRFVLEDDVVTTGRHPDSTIFLDDVTVSRRHAEIVRSADGYQVRDVGSLNGTYLNRERIEEVAPLAHGDELQVGRFKLVFLTAGAAR